MQPGVGHYGVFNGTRWRTEIQPRIRDMIRTIEQKRRRWREVAERMPFAATIVELEQQRRALAEADPQAAAARLAELAREIDTAHEELLRHRPRKDRHE